MNLRQLSGTMAAFGLSIAITSGALAQPAEDATENDKTFYGLGVAIAQNLTAFQLTDEELQLVLSGIQDAVQGKEHGVDLASVMQRIQAIAQERGERQAAAEREAAAAFVAEKAEVARSSGGEVTESGLVYIPMTEGAGARPAATDKVTVHYHGTLRDGTVFDSSVERGQPTTFGLNQVIPCWTEGVQKIKVGGKATLVCPPDIAYGDRATGSIPPGSALVFEVELLEIAGG